MDTTELRECDEDLIERVLGAAIEVHRELGPGLNELVYEKALMKELAIQGIAARNQVEVLAFYKGEDLGVGFRADVIVDESLLLELKVVDEIHPKHLAQVITYLKLLKYKRGFILNFNSLRMKDGIRRVSI